MAIPLIGLLSQLGTGAVGNILEKTLPKANDAMKSMAKAPFMMLENLKEMFGGKESKTPQAEQFSLKTPQNLAELPQKSPDLPQRIENLREKLGQIMDILSNLGDLISKIGNLFGNESGSYGNVGNQSKTNGKQLHQGPMSGINNMVQQQQTAQTTSSGTAGGSSVGGGTGMPESGAQPGSGSGGLESTGSSRDASALMSEQWGMFEKMQSMQRASQMFELAVKIAEVQHQAAMSAIRAIKY